MKPKVRAVVLITATIAIVCLIAAIWWDDHMWKLILTSVVMFAVSAGIAGSANAHGLKK